MEAGLSPPPQVRAQYRHELRTLTYVTLDQANGGIVRNLTHDGIGVQLIAAVHPLQQLRVRFELSEPRLRVETRGEVVWSTSKGQCGIRFTDMPQRLTHQIDEWILGNLLDGAALHPERTEAMFPQSEVEEDDGLILSAPSRKVIELPLPAHVPEPVAVPGETAEASAAPAIELDWLSRPVSPRTLARTVDTLIVVAALLLFALIFLAVIREAPPWPWAMAAGAAVTVSVLYWGFFRILGRSSLGTKLAQLAASDQKMEEQAKSLSH
jgi:hypothetical protein